MVDRLIAGNITEYNKLTCNSKLQKTFWLLIKADMDAIPMEGRKIIMKG